MSFLNRSSITLKQFQCLRNSFQQCFPIIASTTIFHANPPIGCQNLSSSKPAPSFKHEMIRIYDMDGRSIGNKLRKDAEDMAKKRGLVMVPMPHDPRVKPKYPEYQLKPLHEVVREEDESANGTGDTEGSEESPQKKKLKKDIKKLVMSYQTGDSDLNAKILHLNRMVKALHPVKFTITGGQGKKPVLEEMFDKIKKGLIPQAKINGFKSKDESLSFTAYLDLDKEVPVEEIDVNGNKGITGSNEYTIDPGLLNDDEKLKDLLNKRQK